MGMNNAVNDECVDNLLDMFEDRYISETGKNLSPIERKSCWWSICGVYSVSGYNSARNYINEVLIRA